MRVLVADDSTFMRQALTRALSAEPTIEVVGRARNGVEAVKLAKELKPDVITLDIEMPEMDGLTALRRIMREAPTQVLMCSSLTTEGSVQSLQALRLGAADVLAKVNGATLPGGKTFHDELVRLVKALGQENRFNRPTTPTASAASAGTSGSAATTPPPARRSKVPVLRRDRFDLVVIGSSTGGPPVLETVLSKIPAGFPLPIVIAQHMPRLFTESMAIRLNEICQANVVHASHGTIVEPGTVYVCPGNQHSHLVNYAGGNLRLKVSDEPADALYHPSVNVLFDTAAQITGGRTLAAIMTGIGDDGSRGAETLFKQGATILAQDRESCVVYGMPRSVAEHGHASAVLTPAHIGEAIASLASRAAAA